MRPATQSFTLIHIISLILFIFISPVTLSQLIYTYGGNGNNSNDYYLNNTTAICSGIVYPRGLCLATDGTLYLTVSNCIRRIDPTTGNIWTVAGSDTYGHTNDGPLAAGVEFQGPYDLCLDNNNNMYITEWGGNYIRKINFTTGMVTTVAGNGTQGYSGDGGSSAAAILNRPQGISCDVAGNVYFADTYNSRIRRIDASTGMITTVAGTGATSHSGDGGPAVNAGVPYPVDVHIGSGGNIYFIEVFGGNTSRLRKIEISTGIISTVAGNSSIAHTGDGGPATACSLFDPSGIWTDGAGNIYISQYDDSRIRKIEAGTGIINTIAGNGANGYSGDADQAINAKLNRPMGLCVAPNGDLYVADNTNNRIRKISPVMTLPPSIHPAITITASTTVICPGTPVTFNHTATGAGVNPVVYKWEVNGVVVSSDPLPFITSSLNNGDVVTCKLFVTECNNTYFAISNPITITFGPVSSLPTVAIVATATTICTGQNVVFTAATQNAGTNPVYQWKLNGVNTATNASSFSSAGLSDGDQISCTITSDPLTTCGSTLTANSNTITISVSSVLSPSIDLIASDNNICSGTPISFTATVQNAGTSPTYKWKVNGSLVGSNTATYSSNNLSNNDIVTCELVGGTGTCSNNSVTSLPIIITVKPVPVISITPADTLVANGTQVQILATLNVAYNTFQWTPASFLTNPGSLSPLTVPLTTSKDFELSVISVDGCVATSKSGIKIFTPLFMPGAFTPNDDGINDVYRIPQDVWLTLKDFSIYDRWGNRVFRTSNLNKGWDGMLGGVKIDSGVFVYVISGTDDKGPVFVRGTFLLIR